MPLVPVECAPGRNQYIWKWKKREENQEEEKCMINESDYFPYLTAGFLVNQALQTEQLPVQSAASHGQTDMDYMTGSLDNNSLLNQQQHDIQQASVELPLQLLHTIQNPKYKTNTLPGHGLEQTGQHELLCYQSQAQHIYCSIPPIQQQYSGITSYPRTCAPTDQYPYQRIAPHITQESHHLLYPKPIYSYSILIYMALKNSKAGSLPVSEIYNFMTEHFPYFKTAPDGWKNSVRHNLSLNKCFEKVENKSGATSRKGCLWTLNPTKIQKMQEELQKWRRKDPAAVRKSMAKPDELDRLIGERPDKTKSSMMTSPLHSQIPLSPRHVQDQSHSQCLGLIPSPCVLAHPLLPPYSEDRVQVNANPDCSDQSTPRPQLCQPHMYSQTRAQTNNAQDSPLPGQTPPIHGIPDISSQLLMDNSVAMDIHDILVEGEISTDIDALNPSLVDFELQGNLWEVLKDDSLTPDPQVSVAASAQCSSLFPFCWSTSPADSNGVTCSQSSAEHSLTNLQLTGIYSTCIGLVKKVHVTDLEIITTVLAFVSHLITLLTIPHSKLLFEKCNGCCYFNKSSNLNGGIAHEVRLCSVTILRYDNPRSVTCVIVTLHLRKSFTVPSGNTKHS
ncbi:forkhead box protein N1-like [Heterodontus francisci]|uniref:forkhead box protein N1-like n=1 Tax=Heterodontus francisci TaxID=7792 RepID=UPI00355BFBC3